MIFRSCVWFSPPQPPIKMESKDMVSIRCKLIDGEIWYRIDRGASFCHVNRIRPVTRGMPCVTSGTQKWKGANPSLIARATVISVDAVGLNSFVTVHWPEYIKLMMIAIMSSAEAVACVRRYLVEASVARGLGFFIIIGMKAIMFISKPIQASSQ